MHTLRKNFILGVFILVEFKRADSPTTIRSNAVVKVVKLNHIYELTYIGSISQVLNNYKRISKYKMLNIVTGEVIDIIPSVDRSQNINSLRSTIKRLRDLINANFSGSDNELFITLTYAENMTDLRRLYKDFDLFFKKLKYRYKDYTFLYISVVEPQERGAWHIHLLLKALNLKDLYIPNSEIEALWSHGFTKTERLNNVDNVGAYLSAYLTDFVDNEGKKHKGLRLFMYPSGVNIYRCSRNCVKPEVFKINYATAKNFLSDEFKVYEVSYDLFDDCGNLVNSIKKEFYNLKRRSKK